MWLGLSIGIKNTSWQNTTLHKIEYVWLKQRGGHVFFNYFSRHFTHHKALTRTVVIWPWNKVKILRKNSLCLYTRPKRCSHDGAFRNSYLVCYNTAQLVIIYIITIYVKYIAINIKQAVSPGRCLVSSYHNADRLSISEIFLSTA